MGPEAKTGFLHLLGLAKRAGRTELGEDGVSGAAADGKARVVFLAADAAENSIRRARNATASSHAEVLSVPFTKEELGAACGRGSCAMLAITESGLAASAVQKLAVCCPGVYDDSVQRLQEKDKRIRARRAKKRPHKQST